MQHSTLEMERNKGKINGKDMQQIAAAKQMQLKLISYDEDFKGFEEYVIPQEFVKALGKAHSGF